MISLIFAVTISFLFTYYLIPVFEKLAYRLNILDKPDGTIKKHDWPVPCLGGIAVYLGFIIGLIFAIPFENQFLLLILGATLLLFLGLIDDLVQLKPYQKFAGQILAALCFLKSGIYLKERFFLKNPVGSIAISFFWILGSINAINLIDVMDGLAAVISLMATLGFMIIALLVKQYTIAIFLAAFLGALCAFLCYNYPPATIYLGDAGSLFIGGILGSISLLINWGIYNDMGYLAPIVIMAIPPCEVAMLILIRLFKGISFYNASPDHFCMYLLRGGYSKQQILSGVIIISLCLHIAACGILFSKTIMHTMIIGALLILVFINILRVVYLPGRFNLKS